MRSDAVHADSAFSDAELERFRSELPAVTAACYLNAGTLGPLPRSAVAAMQAEHRYDVERRQCERLWERLVDLQTAARAALAGLGHVEPQQVALMHSTHEAINTCVWGLRLRAGDSVVTTDEEHPGVLVPLRHARDRLGCDIRIAAWSDAPALVENVARCCDDSTRAVVLSHVSWLSGRAAPLRLLREALPASCRIIVDGAQSAGAVPLDPTDGWDAYTVSGQKWTCGPNGSGALLLRDPAAWEPTFGAFQQVVDPSNCLGSPIVEDGRRFETSQEAMAPLAGIAASVTWLASHVDPRRAVAHARSLNVRARSLLLPLVESWGADPRTVLSGEAHLLTIDLPDDRAAAVSLALCERHIVIRSLSPRRLRLSFGFWNTPHEVERCVDAIAGCASG